MGYLSMIFNKYSETRDVNLILEFERRLWSSLSYQKLNRYYKYRVSSDTEDEEIKKELEKYSYMPYKVLKSKHKIDALTSEDMVKARVNSNYGKYFDDEIYLGKQYYFHLANYKNIYFDYIDNDINDVLEKLIENEKQVNELKKEAITKKLKMSWEDYKKFINGYIPFIFDNYVPMDDLIELGKWQPNNNLDWEEDNHIIKYINKNLDGYVLMYYNEQIGKRYKRVKKEKYCQLCGKKIIIDNPKDTSKKYCSKCKKTKQLEKYKRYNKKRNYHRADNG